MPGGLKRGSLSAVGIFLGRRLIYSAVVLFGVLVVTFAIVQLVPGDPIRLALGTRYNPEAYQALLEASGLDRPLHEQFFSYVAGALTGDLGVSFRSGQPVTVLLLDRLPATLSLALVGIGIALLISVPAGIWAGCGRASSPTGSCGCPASSGCPCRTSGWGCC